MTSGVRPPLEIHPAEPVRIGRYELLGLLARGGMAEIGLGRIIGMSGFERLVVIKRIRPELADDHEYVQMFLDEARIAAALHHSNIVQVFDLGTSGGQHYQVMEFLLGADVRQIMHWARKNQRQLSLREAIHIVASVCSGLHYAHELRIDGQPGGIVHRDVCPRNVFVTFDGAVKLLDFGIAKAWTNANRGGLKGTPGHMSPEQCLQQPLDRRTDVFAATILLWELTTGARLFPAEDELEMMQAITERDAPRPSAIKPDYPPALERIVMQGLARDRIQRYPSTLALQEELEAFARDAGIVPSASALSAYVRDLFAGETAQWEAVRNDPKSIIAFMGKQRCSDSGTSVCMGTEPESLALEKQTVAERRLRITPGSRRSLRRRLAWPLTLAGVIAVGTLGAFGWSRGYLNQHHSTRSTSARPTVAVFGFRNLNPKDDVAWLSPALETMFRSELAAGEKIRVIADEDLARTKAELGAGAQLEQLHRRLHVDYVLSGAFLVTSDVPPRVRVDLSLRDVASGDVFVAVTDVSDEGEIVNLVARVGERLRAKLAVGDVAATERRAALAVIPASAEAVRLYAEGLKSLHESDPQAAERALDRAATIDPNHPLIHSALASAWQRMGYAERAEAESKRAFDLSSTLPREERLRLEARYRELSGDWDRAIEIEGMLRGFFPDEPAHALDLCSAEILAGHPEQALRTIAELRRTAGSIVTEPELDLLEARAAGASGDRRGMVAASERAIAGARRTGELAILARALGIAGPAAWELGDPVRGAEMLHEAQTIFEKTGDLAGQAGVSLVHAGLLSNSASDPATARRELETALALYRRIGDRNGAASALTNIAAILGDGGDSAGAREMLEQALAEYRATGRKAEVSTVLANLGSILVDQGDLRAADERLVESLALARSREDRESVGDALVVSAGMRLVERRLDEAKRLAREAEASYRSAALAAGAAEADLVLAQVALEEGDADSAAELARAAAKTIAEQQSGTNLALAYAVLARAAIARRQLGEARAAVEQALAAAAKAPQQRARLRAEIAAARVALAESNLTEAHRALDSVSGELRRGAPLVLRWELALAQAEIDRAEGRFAAARKAIRAVEQEAAARGFGLYVHRAKELATANPHNRGG